MEADLADRPNLILVLADQLARGALGCHGNRDAATPHCDALAAAGVRCDAACSTYPICVPYRFTLMTGQPAHTRFVPGIEWRMSPAERTLADEFDAAGYDTLYLGKWHLHGGHGLLPGHSARKANRTPVPRPFQGRWRRWLGFDVGNDPWDSVFFENDDPAPRPIPGWQSDGLTGLLLERLASRDRDRPFCAVLSVEPPHFPYAWPPESEARWRDRPLHLPPTFMQRDPEPAPGPLLEEAQRAGVLESRRQYLAMVENLDANLGRIRAWLAAEGLAERTVLAVTSDHGEMGGAHGCAHWLKSHPFEESVGVPLLAAGPGIAPGTVLREPTCTEDLFPTLLGLCGLTPRDPLPGASLAGAFSGGPPPGREGVSLGFSHHLGEQDWGVYHHWSWRGYRTRRWKYVLRCDARGSRPWQLFDLAADPWEQRNLVADPACQGERERLHRLLVERAAATWDHAVISPDCGCPGLNCWS